MSQQLPDAGPPQNSTHVYFKDVIIAASDDSEDESEPSDIVESGEGMRRRVSRKRKLRIDRQKLIIILVGLPGRGKTFLCNKLMCYLNWRALEPCRCRTGNFVPRQFAHALLQRPAKSTRSVCLRAALWLSTFSMFFLYHAFQLSSPHPQGFVCTVTA